LKDLISVLNSFCNIHCLKMRHFALLSPLMGIVLSGCGTDLLGKFISKKFQDPSAASCVPNIPASASAAQINASNSKILESEALIENLRWDRKSKVHFMGHSSNGGLNPRRVFDLTVGGPEKALSDFLRSSDEVIIPKGTKLVASVIENCEAKNAPKRIKNFDYVTGQDFSILELSQIAEEDECLISLSEGIVYHTTATSNDPRFTDQRHHIAIRSSLAYDLFYDSTNGISTDVVIAIIDSGTDIDHEDLRANLWVNTKEVPGNGRDDDCNGLVDDYEGWNFASNTNNPRPLQWKDSSGNNVAGSEHGTHVAGLAAARWNNLLGGAGVMGVNAKIMALNVFGDSPDGQTSRLNNAIRYAADHGAQIINLSLGGCTRDLNTRDAVQYAVNRGAFVVTAAGNGSPNGRELSSDPTDSTQTNCDSTSATVKVFQTPASFAQEIDGLMSVGSVSTEPVSNQYRRSSFSHYSSTIVEIAAPGSQPPSDGLLSTYPNNQYEQIQGTSMASPVVAGAAGLAYSFAKKKGVTLTPAKMELLLRNSSRNEPLLDSFFRGGKMLDLKSLADEINANSSSYR
jgi:subtilisin family serine protease